MGRDYNPSLATTTPAPHLVALFYFSSIKRVGVPSYLFNPRPLFLNLNFFLRNWKLHRPARRFVTWVRFFVTSEI